MVSVRGFTPEPPSSPEADLVEGGVVTGGEPATPRDTKEQGDTNSQYNRQTTALHPNRPVAVGRRRGMQLQCNVVWNCSSLTLAKTRPGLPRDQLPGPWLFITAEARTSNSSSSAPGEPDRPTRGARWGVWRAKPDQVSRPRAERPACQDPGWRQGKTGLPHQTRHGFC